MNEADQGAFQAGTPPTGKVLWLVALALLVFAGGLWAYAIQLRDGLAVTGLRSIGEGGAAWGLYIVFDIYFVGVSFAGVTLAALVKLFNIEPLKPLTRIAELLTIVALCLAGLAIIADLGRPLAGLLYLPQFARTESPFFGTFTLVVGGYLFAGLVYFYLAGRADAGYCRDRVKSFRWVYALGAAGHRGTAAEAMRHEKVSFWLSLGILPLLIVASSTLGLVFGIQIGRPGWYSALQAPSFIIMASLSGLGILTIVAAGMRQIERYRRAISDEAFWVLSNMIWVLSATYLYFMAVQELTTSYASSATELAVAHSITHGPYSASFWSCVACLLLATVALFTLYVRRQVSVPIAIACGLLVNVAAILKRFLIVVPSQTHGVLIPHPPGSYFPNVIEIAVIAGLFALGVLLYIGFIAVFPMVPRKDLVTTSRAVERRPFTRIFAATITAILGLVSCVVGFAASARVGTEKFLDPVIPFAPVVFIGGLILVLSSAVVYELIPEPEMDLPDQADASSPCDLAPQQETMNCEGGDGSHDTGNHETSSELVAGS